MTRPFLVLLALTLAACEPGSRLMRDAQAAAKIRGVELVEARAVLGKRERAICARGAIYRGDAKRLVLRADVSPSAWATLRANWCGEGADDGAALPLREQGTGASPP